MKKSSFLFLFIIISSMFSFGYANASLNPLDSSPIFPTLCKISNGTKTLKCSGISDTFTFAGSQGTKVLINPTTKTISFISALVNDTSPQGITCPLNEFVNAYDNTTRLFSCTSISGSGIQTLNGNNLANQFVNSANTNHIIVTDSTNTHSIDIAFKVNNISCPAGSFVSSFNNSTGVYSCTQSSGSGSTLDTMQNLGGGTNIYSGNNTNTNFQFNTLAATGASSISTLGNLVTIYTHTYQNNTGTSLGTHGTDVYTGMSGTVLQFPKLVSNNSNCVWSGNSTNDILTCSQPDPAPKISINGNNRTSFTGIIANMTFPAPKVSINGNNRSSFTGVIANMTFAAPKVSINGNNRSSFISVANLTSANNINGHSISFPSSNSGTICLTNQSSVCGSGLSSAILTSQNIGKGTSSFGVLSTPTTSIVKGKNMTSGTGISLVGNTTDITISSTITQGFTSLQNIGKGGFGILKISGNIIQGKNITSTDSHLVVASNTTDINLSTSGLLSSALTTSQNVGKGTGSSGVLATPTSSIVKGKNLTASTGITIVNNATDITISTTALTSAITTSQNIGKGTGSLGVLAAPTSSIVKGKNMTAGTNISLVGNLTDITIAVTGLPTLSGTNIWSGVNQWTSSGALFENPAKTFATTLSNTAITANRTLNLPLTVQTETLAVKPQINFSASSNKTGTTATTGNGVMLGDGVTLTPTVTGRAEITVSGYTTSSVSADGGLVEVRQITGSCPANAAAVTGTALGSNIKQVSSGTTARVPFSITVQTTGLTISQKYCFELRQEAITGGTFTVFNVMWSAKEI